MILGFKTRSLSSLGMHMVESVGYTNSFALEAKSKVLIQGTLEKRRVWTRSWKKRFFVLESNGKLSYFRSEEDKEFPERARGKVPISNDTRIEESRTGGKWSIKIYPTDTSISKTVKISAESEQAHQLWIKSLQAVQNDVYYVSMYEI